MSHNEKQGTAILCVCLVSYTCVYVFVYACACLLAWSVCASVPVSITVSGWAGNGRMKLWQRPVTPTPFPLCAAVSPCLINVVRSVAHGEISVSRWAWTVLCHPLCSRSGVYTWQWVGMCCWCDSPSVTGVHFGCLHLLHAVLSPWTHEVWGGHMSVSHRKNPNIGRKVIPFFWDLTWHLDKQITSVQWQCLWKPCLLCKKWL